MTCPLPGGALHYPAEEAMGRGNSGRKWHEQRQGGQLRTVWAGSSGRPRETAAGRR